VDKLIVVDYHEGAGGEFIARFISAHLGHELEFDQQRNPSHIQKWLNSTSIVTPSWGERFPILFHSFLKNCQQHKIDKIAVPYHLYKWPDHVDAIRKSVPRAQFVRINPQGYENQIAVEFQRKVLDRPLTDFQEVQFMLANKDRNFVKSMLELYKQQRLTYRDLFPVVPDQSKPLPSNDIEINYSEFFVDLDQTPRAYEKLCSQLNLTPDILLLSALLERNKKNQQDLDNHLSKI